MTTQTPTKPRATTRPKPRTRPAEPVLDRLPPYNLLLHNDDHHDMAEVVHSLVMVTPTTKIVAARIMLAAHFKGRALVLTAHKERAEFFRDRLRSRGLIATIEPAA
jgi:ATP-dependent Clp protease adaptor protein ClpS